MTHNKNERVWVMGGVTILITAIIFLGYWFGVFNTLQEQLTDRFYVSKDVTSEILIIDIDEESLESIGQWPWSRATHAKLLDNIVSANTVGFDIIFSEPSRLGEEDDSALAESIARFDGVVVLPEVISEQSGLTVSPVSVLKNVSKQGFVNTEPERDGVVRFTKIIRENQPGFDAIISKQYVCNNTSPCAPDVLRINYHGPAQTYTTISYVDVYEGRIPASLFKNKIILVGASASGLGDSYPTPFGTMSGVEIHANTIETLQSGKYIKSVSTSVSTILFILIGILAFVIVTNIRTASYLYAAIVVVFFGIILDAYAAFAFSYVVPHLYELILFVVLIGALLLIQYVYETKEKKFILDGFEHYVAPEVVNELYDNPEKLTLGGESRVLTVLFSDIRGFTTISEQLTPQQLMEQLNEYLEEMSEAVMQKNGLVDKYIGDAVMAFWGAPLANKDHAINACESTISMMSALKELNKKWTVEGKPTFEIGVGISTGDVVVGNMGSKRRFNYSIIGDEVNFAARIEGLTKEYKINCIIGADTYKAIEDIPIFKTRELDKVTVKGKEEPKVIYELITENVTQGKTKALKEFDLGLSSYKNGAFDDAIEHFEQALVSNPNDGPSEVFLERSKTLLKNPPKNWDGVFKFTTK